MSVSAEVRFSVVIPVYRGRATVARAVASVDRQNPAPNEIVVIDNEPDSRLQEVLPATRSRLIVVPEPRRGAAAARNAGLRLAASPYVAFLDCDDSWDPGFLAAMERAIRRHPSAALYTGKAFVIRDDGSRRVPAARIDHRGFQKILIHNSITTSATVVLAEAAMSHGGFREGLRLAAGCEDWALWLALLRTQPGVTVPAAHATRFEDLDTLRMRGDATLYLDMLDVLRELFPPDTDDIPAAALAGMAMHRGTQALRGGDAGEARGHFLSALRLQPVQTRLWLWLALSWLPPQLARRIRSLRRRALGVASR
ncbi:MAG: glycosyltransferase family 2 protein [Candidatus Dormibacteraeota bacterium]|uniref:Glycosyltransferase family 2 protein n=2 Tax=Candidatus Aeolococcus gillhamiae TaxID=3127015 RepID=A0A934JZR0_9BACT|nr:glycosyltransferase family 2 protein [Candidatus Dormibacteraeota bacterium]